MSYRVTTLGFEGPFDLLLQLVMRQKVDIGSVRIADIADQYLDEVAHLEELDLDIATDFVAVASILLDIKAQSLVPDTSIDDVEDDIESLSADEMREVLIARLMAYRMFKSASAMLSARQHTEQRMHPRYAGPDPEFLGVMPDYLIDITVQELGQICADFLARRERLLLESEHIAAKRVPLETRVEQVDSIIKQRKELTFDELIEQDVSIENRVVSLLALLELSKRDEVELFQPITFGTLTIRSLMKEEHTS